MTNLNKLINSSNYSLYIHCCCWWYDYKNIDRKLHNVMWGHTLEAPVNLPQLSKTSWQSQTTLSLSTTSQTKTKPRWSTEKATEWTGGSGKRYTSGKNKTKSMNQVKGSYQLPHFCDYLLSATPTPGGQSFRRRQQRLPKRQQQQCI